MAIVRDSEGIITIVAANVSADTFVQSRRRELGTSDVAHV